MDNCITANVWTNTHLYGQARGGLVGTHMPFRVIANSVAAFLFLTNDLWPAALHGYCGVPSKVCGGFSIMARTTEGGGGVYVILTAADKTWGWLMGLMMMMIAWRITFRLFQDGNWREIFLRAMLWQFNFLSFFFYTFPISKVIVLFLSSLLCLNCYYLKHTRLTGFLLFYTFQTCFLPLWPLSGQNQRDGSEY